MWLGYLNCGSHELKDWETKVTKSRIVSFCEKRYMTSHSISCKGTGDLDGFIKR